MATVDAGTAARELLHVVMLVMRTVAADMRREPGAVAPAQMGTLMKVSVGPCTMSSLARHQAVSLPTVSKSVDMLVRPRLAGTLGRQARPASDDGAAHASGPQSPGRRDSGPPTRSVRPSRGMTLRPGILAGNVRVKKVGVPGQNRTAGLALRRRALYPI